MSQVEKQEVQALFEFVDICGLYTEGEDYIRVNDILRMESGFTAGACTPLVVSVIKDGVLESDETLQLQTDASGPTLSSSSNGGTTLITIIDDDSACEYYKIIVYRIST